MDNQQRAYLQNYLKEVEGQIADIRGDLEPLESGQMHLGERSDTNPEWKDTTQSWIEHHKRNIAMYEKIAAALRKQIDGIAP